MNGETLSPEELQFLQQDGPETQQQYGENASPDIPTDDAVRQILNSHGIEHHIIEPHHIRQYQAFYRLNGRHPTEDEINAHVGD